MAVADQLMALALAGIVCLGPRIRLFAALPDLNETNDIRTEADLSEIVSSPEKSSLSIEGSETARLIRSLDAELKGRKARLLPDLRGSHLIGGDAHLQGGL